MSTNQVSVVSWLQLALALLVQTAVVAAFVTGLAVDIDYLKRDLAESKSDRAALHGQLMQLIGLTDRSTRIEQTLLEVRQQLEKHMERDK